MSSVFPPASSPLINAYKRLPISLSRGEGAWVWDRDNKKYLDALCGIGVTGLGHNHPEVTRTIQDQAAKILHTSNLFQIDHQIELGTELRRLTGLKNAQSFFNNSGAEAVETAIKLSRLYGHHIKNLKEPQILVFEGAFHGRTMAAISAGGNPKYKKGFDPLLPGFIQIAFDDVSAVEAAAREYRNIVAVLVEPIQGEGGIRIPKPDYLNQLRAICDKHQWLLMTDEIQCGLARSGRLFCYEHNQIKPDVIMLAKCLANGLPIGACVMTQPYAELFTPGSHGSTFGGNPLAMATALTVLKVIETQRLWENAEKQGAWLLDQFQVALKAHASVKGIRGKGLMLGIELDRPCRDLLPKALEKGLLFNIAQETTIRLLPPLILERTQAEFILETVIKLIKVF